MGSKGLLFALALALLVGLYLTFGAGAPTAPEVTPTPAPTAGTPGASSAVAETTADPHPEPGTDSTGNREEQVTTATWVVRGVVQRGGREPQAGVPVQLEMFAGYDTDGALLREVELESDAQGRFAWPLEPPTETVFLRGRVIQDEVWSRAQTSLRLPGQEPPEWTFTLSFPDAHVVGQVTDSDGNPLAEARVKGIFGATHTDTEGRYRLTGTSDRSRSMIYATAEGFTEERETADRIEPGGTARVDFELNPSMQVAGRVVDENGRPVADAVIQSFFVRQQPARSDSQGAFVLDHLDPRRESHSVFARHEGYVEAQTRVKGTTGRVEIDDLVLIRGVRVHGRVLDPSGRPLPGASLYIGFSPSAYNRLDATAEDDGQFEFPHVPTGDQTLVASHAEHAPQTHLLTLEPDSSEHEIVLHMETGHWIAGTAVDENGEPLDQLWVSPRHGGQYMNGRVQLDEEGRFRLEHLPGEGVDLEFYGTGVVRQNVPVAALDRDDLKVTIQRAGKIAGRVVDGASGEPLQSFTIRFVAPAEGQHGYGYSASWSREGHRFSDSDGYWDSGNEDLTPGQALGVEVQAEGYAPGRLPTVVIRSSPDPDAHVVAMYPGAAIVGRLLDAEGLPVAGAKVGIFDAANPRRRMDSEGHGPGIAISAADGTFRIDPVAGGDRILRVETIDRAPHEDGPFLVPASGELERLVQLPAGFVLEGFLRAVDGTALPGETVMLHAMTEEDAKRFSREVESGADGAFAFSGLPAGSYQLTHSRRRQHQTVYAHNLHVLVSEDTRGVQLQRTGPCRIVGTLVREDGKALPAVTRITVRYIPPDPKRWGQPRKDRESMGSGTLAEGESFAIDGFEPGEYVVEAHHWGLSMGRVVSGSTRVELQPGDNVLELPVTEHTRSGR